jgi:UDPglucose 6-dehydrogenase
MAIILIVGAGIVGQANGKGLTMKGHTVIFVDTNPEIVQILRRQGFKAYLPTEIKNGISHKKIDVSMFCVPTPLKELKDNEYGSSIDLSNITSAVINHGELLKKHKKTIMEEKRGHYHHLVVIRSTVPPGTTRNILLPLLELHSGMKVGIDIGLCMQPEFLRTVTSETDFLNPRATLIGEFDKSSGDMLQKIYADFNISEIFRANLETAEFIKYANNCFNATKISFANEMWLVAQQLGIEANLALQMAVKSAEGFWNPSYGTKGGKPYDGRCLPKDIKCFLTFAKQIGIDMPLLKAVDSVNSHMEGLTKVHQQVVRGDL